MEVSPMRLTVLFRKLGVASLFLFANLFILFAGVCYGVEGEGGGGLTVIPDRSVFIQIANFLFLIWVLNLILYKPIRNVLIQRKEKVSGLEQSIETFKRDAKEKEDAFAVGLRKARAKGLLEKENLLNDAADQEKEIIAKINDKAQADLAKIREKIAKDADAARQSLLQEVDSFAEAIGQKILGRSV
jgi:F-type H+-transporting ATPase subunit b